MPSKMEYELTKLRGEVSDTNEIYSDTIAALKDSLSSLSVNVTALDAIVLTNKKKTTKAIRKADKAMSNAISSVKKSGDTMIATDLRVKKSSSELEVIGGEITVSGLYHEIFCTAAPANLETINGGYDGRLLILYSASAHTITVKNDAASHNIYCGTDRLLSTEGDIIVLVYSSSMNAWNMIAYQTNSTLLASKADTINEATAGSGVTVDSVLLKDSNVDAAGLKACYITGGTSGLTTQGALAITGNVLYVYLGGAWYTIDITIAE